MESQLIIYIKCFLQYTKHITQDKQFLLMMNNWNSRCFSEQNNVACCLPFSINCVPGVINVIFKLSMSSVKSQMILDNVYI